MDLSKLLQALKALCALLVGNGQTSEEISRGLTSGVNSAHVAACIDLIAEALKSAKADPSLKGLNHQSIDLHLGGAAVDGAVTKGKAAGQSRTSCNRSAFGYHVDDRFVGLAQQKTLVYTVHPTAGKGEVYKLAVFQDEGPVDNGALCNHTVVCVDGCRISAEAIFQALKLLVLHALRARQMAAGDADILSYKGDSAQPTIEFSEMSQEDVDAKALELLGMAPLPSTGYVRSIQLTGDGYGLWNTELAPATMFVAMLIVGTLCPAIYEFYDPDTAFMEMTNGVGRTLWGFNLTGDGDNVCGTCASVIARLRAGVRSGIAPAILDLYDAVRAAVSA